MEENVEKSFTCLQLVAINWFFIIISQIWRINYYDIVGTRDFLQILITMVERY